MVIGTGVEDDGQDSVGLDTGSEGVQGSLGEGDRDSTDTLICTGYASLALNPWHASRQRGARGGHTTDSQDGLAIGDDDEVDQAGRVGSFGESRQVGLFLQGFDVRLELGAHPVLVGETLYEWRLDGVEESSAPGPDV